MFSDLSKKQHALMTSWCLRKENRLLGVLSPAAFLVEIGKVLIAQEIMSEGKEEAFRDALKELQDVEAAEKEVIGVDTPEVSATIFSQWKFEENLVDVLGNCQNPEQAKEEDKRPARILQVVRIAVPINGKITDASIEAAKELIEKYALDMDSFDTAIENIK